MPWPVISRGTEATVPSPPGLVSVMFAPSEVVGGERVRARLLHQRVVRREERVERQPARVADHGHHQRPGAVLLLDVHRQAEVHLSVVDPVGLAVDLGEVVGHHRHVARGAGDRVGDQVREGDLAPAAFSSRRRASRTVTVSVRKLVAVGIERDCSM